MWQLPCALAPNFGTIIVARFLGGISSAGGSVTLGMGASFSFGVRSSACGLFSADIFSRGHVDGRRTTVRSGLHRLLLRLRLRLRPHFRGNNPDAPILVSHAHIPTHLTPSPLNDTLQALERTSSPSPHSLHHSPRSNAPHVVLDPAHRRRRRPARALLHRPGDVQQGPLGPRSPAPARGGRGQRVRPVRGRPAPLRAAQDPRDLDPPRTSSLSSL